MKKRSFHLAYLALLPFAVAQAPAKADGGVAWLKETTDKGCYLHEFGNAYSGMATDPNRSGFVWSGACTPGRPINGEGTLYFQNKSPSGAMVWSYTGRIVNGLPDGPMRVLQYVIGADGTWDPAAGASDPNFSEILFRQGCPSFAEAQCQPGVVQQAIALQPVTPPHFPLPKSQPAKLQAQSEVPPSDGDVFGQCVTVHDLGRTGIQWRWQLRNSCSVRVKVAYCLRSRFDAAGDPTLCKAREHRNVSIASDGDSDFFFSLKPDGTAMSDGRVARDDYLKVVGYACMNGNSPSVYFENGQFIFQHC